MNKMIQWMAEHNVTANLLMLSIVIAGIIKVFSLKQEVFPEISLDYVQAYVEYPGASPEEVEDGIILKLEESISGLDGIKEITGTAAEGGGTVLAELSTDANPDRVLQDIKNEVDRITTFPEDSEKPTISKVISKQEVISVVVYGDIDEKALRERAEAIRDDLLDKDGITQVSLSGVRDYEIKVELSEDKMRKFNISPSDIGAAIKASSVNMPAGKIKTKSGEILLRTKEKKYSGLEYENIDVISSSTGAIVKLRDIATVKDGFEDRESFAVHNGKPAAIIKVFRTGKEKPTDISEIVNKYVDEKSRILPPSVKLDIVNDTSILLRSRINLLLKNAWLGLSLVMIVLGLFLEIRLAFWVMLGVPVSFLGALAVLPVFDVSINMISLFAFILALGILVDDAIVVGENIYERRMKGDTFLKAAVEGAQEIATPVIFAVLTTMAAFLPIAYVEGVMGKFMRQIPIVVISLFFFSLVESLLILPAHLAHSKKRTKENLFFRTMNKVQKYANRKLDDFVNGPYHRLLSWCLKNRYIAVCTGFAILFTFIGIIKGGIIKFNFMPAVDGDYIIVTLKMPPGTPLEETERLAYKIQEQGKETVLKIDKTRPGRESMLKSIFTLVGGTLPNGGPVSGGDYAATNVAEMVMSLEEAEQRDYPVSKVKDMWRDAVGEIAGADSLIFATDLVHMGSDIAIQAKHENFDVLEKVSSKIREKLAEYPGVFDIDDNLSPGKMEFQFKLTDKAKFFGVSAFYLGSQIRDRYYGNESLRLQMGKNEIKVMVNYPEDDRMTLNSLYGMRIKLPNGGEVPLKSLAELKQTRGYSTIKRVDQKRSVTIEASVDASKNNASEIMAALQGSVFKELKADYPGINFELAGEQKEQKESMGSMGEGFLMAIFAIYFLLALPFNSYAEPFLIMISIPFGIIGAIIGHLAMGFDLTMLSMFGIVALSGVVVNDSLLMIDTININIKNGLPVFNAVLDSGKRRLRPIMLTSLTTFFGLMPMITEKSLQAQFLIPMAISLGFGILFATFITLLLIPSFYMCLNDFTHRGEKYF